MRQDNPFKNKYHSLTAAESWTEIITQGEADLATQELTNFERAELHELIAKAHHHLGQYDNTILHSTSAFNLTDEANLRARACYLASAGYRSKFDLGSNNLDDKTSAKQWIETALSFTNDQNLDDGCRAKIHFNAGALYQDAYQDNVTAEKHYQTAVKFYQIGSDDYNRTVLRIARSRLESGNTEPARAALEALRPYIPLDSKTYIHFLQLEAKIEIAVANYEQANSLITQAITLAEIKQMAGDLKRLNDLSDSLAVKKIILHENANDQELDSLNSVAENRGAASPTK